jgi:hypothetical protein
MAKETIASKVAAAIKANPTRDKVEVLEEVSKGRNKPHQTISDKGDVFLFTDDGSVYNFDEETYGDNVFESMTDFMDKVSDKDSFDVDDAKADSFRKFDGVIEQNTNAAPDRIELALMLNGVSNPDYADEEATISLTYTEELAKLVGKRVTFSCIVGFYRDMYRHRELFAYLHAVKDLKVVTNNSMTTQEAA